DQCHDIDRVQALYGFQPGKSTLRAQVIIRDDHDLADELALAEVLAHLLEELLSERRIRSCRLDAATREKCQPYPQRQVQLGEAVLARWRRAVWIEELAQARRAVVDRLGAATVRST